MSDTRHKDRDWNLGTEITWNMVQTAVLMDIRDELKRLNSVLHCTNFLAIPSKLDAIRRNTAKKRRKKP